MRTESRNVYTYNELSDPAKEKARDWYRQCSEGDDWWKEGVFEHVQKAATYLGITIDTRKGATCIHFSGFGNQGDGACFHGTWHGCFMKKSVEELTTAFGTTDTALLTLYRELKQFYGTYPESSCTSSVNGYAHYSNERSTHVAADLGLDSDEVETEAMNDDRDAIEECMRDFMQWIYAMLQAEDDYRNSDAEVEESILFNEYDFLENGKRL